MDIWQYGVEIARGESKRRMAATLGSRPLHAHLATVLPALARRLDPARHAAF